MEKNTLAEIEKILREFKGQPDLKITADTRLDGLGMDSLDTVSVVMDIEDKLGVAIDIGTDATTFGDVVKIIEAQKK
jgi:acyl carrier protein